MMMREVGVAEWWDMVSKRNLVVTMILSGNQMVIMYNLV